MLSDSKLLIIGIVLLVAIILTAIVLTVFKDKVFSYRKRDKFELTAA